MCQYEKEMKKFKECLDRHTATMEEIKKDGEVYTETGWMKLSEVNHDVERRARLSISCRVRACGEHCSLRVGLVSNRKRCGF